MTRCRQDRYADNAYIRESSREFAKSSREFATNTREYATRYARVRESSRQIRESSQANTREFARIRDKYGTAGVVVVVEKKLNVLVQDVALT